MRVKNIVKAVVLALAMVLPIEAIAQQVTAVPTTAGSGVSLVSGNWTGYTAIQTLGRNTVGDGNGGLFAYASSCPNGSDSGTGFQDASGNWWCLQYKLLHNGYFDTNVHADEAAAALGVPLYINTSLGAFTGNYTATAQWIAAGGIVSNGSNLLTLNRAPITPRGAPLFNSSDAGGVLSALGDRWDPQMFGGQTCPVLPISYPAALPCSYGSPVDNTDAFARLFAVDNANTQYAQYPIYLDGMYAIGTGSATCGLTISPGIQYDILGSAQYASGLLRNCSGGGALLNFSATNSQVTLQDFLLTSSSAGTGGTAGDGLSVGGSANYSGPVVLKNVNIENQPGNAADLFRLDRLSWIGGTLYENAGIALNFEGQQTATSLVQEVRAIGNGGNCAYIPVGNHNITLDHVECLNNNRTGSPSAQNNYEIYMVPTSSSNSFECLSCDIEGQGSPNDTGGIELTGYNSRVINTTFGTLSGVLINMASCNHCRVEGTNYVSETSSAPTAYVATDCSSYANYISLSTNNSPQPEALYLPASECGPLTPGHLNGAANAIYVDNSQVPQKYKIPEASTVTPSLMQYFVGGNILNVTGASASFTLKNPTAITDTVTFTNGSSAIAVSGVDTPIVGAFLTLSTTGSLPTNFATGTTYCVVSTTLSTFSVSATCTGGAILAGSAGSGMQTANISPMYSFRGYLEIDATAGGVTPSFDTAWHTQGTIGASSASGQKILCPFAYDQPSGNYYLGSCAWQ